MIGQIAGALLIAVTALGAFSAQAQTPPPKKLFVRQSLHEFLNDPQKLTSLIRGVLVMKQRNSAPKDSADYRTSWEYWANIHGYGGGKSGKVADIQQRVIQRSPENAALITALFSGLTDQTPPDELAKLIWETCKHSTQSTKEPHFLSWHRIYLYFFERVLRKASGDPDFALPYWDYSNDAVDAPDPTTSPRRLPSIFIVPTLQTQGGGQIANPLFEPKRTAGFGLRVQLDPIDTNIDSSLALSDFAKFQNGLETSLHGFVHCAVGSACLGPYMGIVPFAGNDPIFWHHHANIDRFWSCWTERYGRDANPTADNNWMKEEFFFVDENGDKASMKVSELFDPNGRIDFSYDNVKKCFRVEPPALATAAVVAANSPRGPTELATRAQFKVSNNEVATSAGVQINALEQEVPLTSSARTPAGEAAMLSAVQPNSVSSSKATLTLQNIELSQEPGAAVRVFLVNKKDNRRAFVASLNFFGWTEHDHAPAGNNTGRTVSFNVTAQLRELQSDSGSGDGLGVVFAASNGLSGDAPAVTAQSVQRAGLKIGKISLDLENQTRVLDLR